jgi:ubiquinone/menaquinone biosynthesis C-methylase UbiE
MVDYDARLHAVYAEGRRISPETVRLWMAEFGRHVGSERPLVALDLGAGTGRFSPALAEAFGGPVYAVEPSDRMRSIARQTASHPRVRYLKGAAEAIPLTGASCDLALMFLSFHHFRDQRQGLAEVARVLKPGGVALMRTQFADQMPDLFWYDYFPSAREIDAGLYRTLAETKTLAEQAGLVSEDEPVRIIADEHRTLGEAYERLRLRALSTFEHLPEAEVEDGFERFHRDAATHPDQLTPSVEATLLVLRRPSAP